MNKYHDIALLRIRNGVDTLMKIPPGTSFQNNILVLNSEKNIDKDIKMSIAGWGVINTDDHYKISPEVLQKTEIKLIGVGGECAQILDESFNQPLGNKANTVLCANNTRTDACQGDSGGPLFRKSGSKWIAYGITSFGYIGVAHDLYNN